VNEDQAAAQVGNLRCSPAQKPTLVLGLGNPILRDDGVGWRIVESAREQWCGGVSEFGGKTRILRLRAAKLPPPSAQDAPSRPQTEIHPCRDDDVEFDAVALGGISLMERLIGYRRAVLVDSIQTEGGAVGAVYRLTLDDLPTLHADAIHDASLKAALELGRRLGARLPDDITIVAVEARDLLDFGEALSPAVEAAVPAAVALVLETLIPLEVPNGDEGGTVGLT
jgi:hydrogenase maturation protease